MKVLFFGDVYGKAGRQTVRLTLPELKEEFQPDFILANSENLADGRGVTEKHLTSFLMQGLTLLPEATIYGIEQNPWNIFAVKTK